MALARLAQIRESFHLQGSPIVRLRAVPVTVIQNCTTLPLVLVSVGLYEEAVPPKSTHLASWQTTKQRPINAVLTHRMPDGTKLSSEPFQIEDGEELLLLQSAPAGRQILPASRTIS